MIDCLRGALIGVLLAVGGLVMNSASAETLTAMEQARLTKGEPVVRVMRDAGSATSWASGRAFAAIDIPATPEKVFKTLVDCARIVRFVRNIVSCKILGRDPKGLWETRETIVTISQMLPNFRATARADYVPYKQIRFKQLEGSFDFLEGQWDLAAFRSGQSTRLFYKVRAGTSVPVPEFMIQNLIENDVPTTLKALRQEVVRGAASK